MNPRRTFLGCTAALSLLACGDVDSPAQELPTVEHTSDAAVVAPAKPPTPVSSADASTRPAPPGSEFYVEPSDAGAAAGDAALVEPHDDGVACELRHRYDYPSAGDVTQFDEPWLAVETFNGAGSIEVAPDGSLYLIGTFGHELDLGAGEVRADAPISGFLHKLDSDCKPVRTQVLRASFDGQLAVPAAIDIDPHGNVYVAMLGGPLVDLRPYHPYPIRWSTEFVVEKFSPQGESLYRASMPAHNGWLSDMEVDAQGQVYLSGTTSAFASFGGQLPPDLSPVASHTFALALDAQGRYRAHQWDTGATMIEVAGERIYSLANTNGSVGTLRDLLGTSEDWEGVSLHARDDTLRPLWDVGYPRDSYVLTAEGLANGGVALVFASVTQADGREQQSLRVRRYASDGTPRPDAIFAERGGVAEARQPFQISANDIAATFFQFVRETPDRGLALTAGFYSNVMLAGTELKGATRTGSIQLGDYTVPSLNPGAAVLKLDSQDRVVWARQQEWGKVTVMLGLAPAPSGDVFVTGIGLVGAARAAEVLEYDLVVRKLRAD